MEFHGSLDQRDVFNTLPVHLRRRVVHEVYFSQLQTLHLIRMLEEKCPGIASIVLPRLRPAVYGAGEVMVSSSMCPREVTFVMAGSCQCIPTISVIEEELGNATTVVVGEGAYFGQDTLFFPPDEIPELAVYVKASEATETATLTLDDWVALERIYPTVMELFKKLLLENSVPDLEMIMMVDQHEKEFQTATLMALYGKDVIAPVLRPE